MHSGDIIRTFQPIMANTEGICGFISQASSPRLMRVLEGIEQSPLTKVQLDQLLSLQGICCVTDGFFRYYWLTAPRHFYRLEPIALPEACDGIASIEQLRWGFNRLFIDCLLLFGNIPMGFRTLAQMSYEALEAFLPGKGRLTRPFSAAEAPSRSMISPRRTAILFPRWPAKHSPISTERANCWKS